MSDVNPQSSFDVRGAVDLAALARPQSPPPGQPGGAPAPGGYVVDVTAASFEEIVQGSTQYPVVVLLWLPTDEANAKVAADLGTLADDYAGRFLLARVDAQAEQQIAAAFQVEGVPTVVLLLNGQPFPLFQGGAELEQMRQVFDEILQQAEANGIVGRAPLQGEAPETAEESEPEQEPELPPLHQEAYDAIERDDFEAAAAAFTKASKQDPKDELAVAGLAQVGLLSRTRGKDLAQVRKAAADAPTDVDAQLDVADMDMLGGKVEDALGRLLELLPGLDADAKEKIRVRLLDYFQVVGTQDPRVAKARQQLAISLY
ncbi:co-chaperone YbbN [Paraoerskovia marina]|uniref:co-chaperone YbbN n=1 Tax=Paraoerskovia marina TaxID=545619 RepID=UPI00049298D1|nr:tetratricopeptide repeat protein [Paraoerskovia marina]